MEGEMMKNRTTLKSRFRSASRRLLECIRSDSAQALVELAFVLPVASFLLVGTIEIGRLANTSIVVNQAARAGVQYGAQNRVTASDTAGMTQAAQQDASDIKNLTVTASHFCACSDGSASTCQPTDCSGSRILEYVKVDTQTQLHTLLPYPEIPRSFTVKGQDVMRVSQ
jgi:Flp pilus assembly protein TadG